jgi:plastocyanin
MRLRGIALILLVVTLGLGVAACGGDDEGNGEAAEPGTTAAQTDETTTDGETEDDGGGEATTLELAADPGGQLAFDKEELTAAAGTITIELTNEASIPHNVSVEGQTSETIQGGATTELDLDLEAGEYEFICAVPGHAAGGMTGTLIVE